MISGYDKNGNILGLLRRYDNSIVDSLNYKYHFKSNKIRKVTDSGIGNSNVDDYPGTSENYEYDVSGNMIYDGSKNFCIDYTSPLNLPVRLDFGGNNRIFYHYTASGVKTLKHISPSQGAGTFLYYVGNILYEGDTLRYIITDDGRLLTDNRGPERKYLYEYSIKDHLGNSRAVFTGSEINSTAELIQSTSYYPFGLVMKNNGFTDFPENQKNKYLYNGKELQDQSFGGVNLNWYDYGARFYDAQLGRFHTQDAFAEKYISMTPYQYGANNPIRYIDINGDSLDVTNTKQSRDDINGMVKDKNQQYIDYNGDRLSLDFGNMNKKDIKRTLRNDKGLKLINDVANAQEKYSYSATHVHGQQLEYANSLQGPYSPGGGLFFSTEKLVGISVDASTPILVYSWFSNSSKTPRGDEVSNGLPFIRPTKSSGYDAIVEISPGYVSNALGIKQDRSKYVRHELKESYLRTSLQMPYEKAHQQAGYPRSFEQFTFTK